MEARYFNDGGKAVKIVTEGYDYFAERALLLLFVVALTRRDSYTNVRRNILHDLKTFHKVMHAHCCSANEFAGC